MSTQIADLFIIIMELNMNNPEFTKGPWHWEINLNQKSLILYSGIKNSYNDLFGLLQTLEIDRADQKISEPEEILVVPIENDNKFQKINQSDAALIAEAPDMYEEIEKQIEFMHKIIKKFPMKSDIFMEACERIVDLENTLSKARG